MNLEKCKIKEAIKESLEIQIKFKVDFESINLNENIVIQFKLLDDKNKD